MSKFDLLRDKYKYNEWAMTKLLDTADFAREEHPDASFHEIIPPLAHVVAAQITWLERWTTGGNQRSTQSITDSMPTLQEVRAEATKSFAALRDYFETLSDDAIEQSLTMRDSSGKTFGLPLWKMLAHVDNHGTQHRSEAALALTAMGHSPGDLDYLDFVELRA
jgi:uncharacterized damage-inducible protein DinB